MMAIYHCSVKIISRGAGRSAVGAAAYRAGEKLHNEHDGITHDYTNRRGAVGAAAYRSGERLQHDNMAHDFTTKKGIVHSEIMLPEHAPRAYQDRATLWNSVEQIEKQSNARTAREVEIALPNELNTEQQIQLVREYVHKNFVNEGMCADFSIHSGHKHVDKTNPDEHIKPNNPHAHIMLTVRPLNDDGTWGAKSKKEYMLDRRGERIKLKSGEWKSRKIDTTDWDKKESLVKWRENWAATVNKEFERLGIDERIDHRTLAAQGIEREPTIHVGVTAQQMEARGLTTERGQENREIQQRNNELDRIDNRIKEVERMKQQIRETREKRRSMEQSVREHLRNQQQRKGIEAATRQTAPPIEYIQSKTQQTAQAPPAPAVHELSREEMRELKIKQMREQERAQRHSRDKDLEMER